MSEAKSRSEAIAKMKPGDIVLTSIDRRLHRPTSLSGAIESVFRRGTKAVQGDFTHSALYTGDGKVVELRYDTGLRRVPLNTATRNKDFVAVRPEVPAPEKREAVKRIEQIYADHKDGKKVEYSSLPFLLKTLAAHVTKSKSKGTDEVEKNRFICSNIISHVYPKTEFVEKGTGYIIPKDFLSSGKTRTVVVHRNRKRHDREKISMHPKVLEGFHDTVEKVAIIGAVGSKMLGWAGKGAKAIGQGKRFGAMRGAAGRALGGQQGLARAVGAGTLATGAGLGAGVVAGANK